MHYIWCTKKYVLFVGIRDGPDIKSAGYPATGYPARQLSRIPDIRLAGYMAGYPAKPDIRPTGYPARHQIYQIILSKQCLLSEKAGYPALISGRPDIRPAGYPAG